MSLNFNELSINQLWMIWMQCTKSVMDVSGMHDTCHRRLWYHQITVKLSRPKGPVTLFPSPLQFRLSDKLCKLVNILCVSIYVPSLHCCIFFLLLFATLWWIKLYIDAIHLTMSRTAGSGVTGQRVEVPRVKASKTLEIETPSASNQEGMGMEGVCSSSTE